MESTDFDAFAAKVVGSNGLTVKLPEHPEELAGIDNRGFHQTAEVHRNRTLF